MTELMKRYEAETGCASIAIWRGECTVSNKYVDWLEDQLTWRPVSEKPERADYYLVKTLNFVFKAYFDGERFLKVIDQKLVGVIATHWLPIPPAPEGE